MNSSKDAKISFLTDFYIDFFGSLIPGLFFTLLAAPTVWWSFAVCNALCKTCCDCYFGICKPSFGFIDLSDKLTNLNDPGFKALETLGTSGSIGILLITAYVIGSIFYRRDPKIPDHKSARLIWSKLDPDDRKRHAVQPTEQLRKDHERSNSEITTQGKKPGEISRLLKFIQKISSNAKKMIPGKIEEKLLKWKSRLLKFRFVERMVRANEIELYDTQFPYFFLKEYLENRGLKHLAEHIPWSGNDVKSWEHRTKNFINILKIRLQFMMPEKCRDIIRNEAHVRMATSIWYAAIWQIRIGAIALATALTAILVAHYTLIKESDFNSVIVILIYILAFDAFTITLAVLIMKEVEKFIHYLRVREVVYVLETAHFANLFDETLPRILD